MLGPPRQDDRQDGADPLDLPGVDRLADRDGAERLTHGREHRAGGPRDVGSDLHGGDPLAREVGEVEAKTRTTLRADRQYHRIR